MYRKHEIKKKDIAAMTTAKIEVVGQKLCQGKSAWVFCWGISYFLWILCGLNPSPQHGKH